MRKNNKIRTSIMLDKDVVEALHSTKHITGFNVSKIVNSILKEKLCLI